MWMGEFTEEIPGQLAAGVNRLGDAESCPCHFWPNSSPAAQNFAPSSHPSQNPEPRYRPSTALDEFVRTRDLTCRAVGCDRPAMHADIDHTVPYPAGAHPGNLKCYCRIQMTRKTL